MRFDKTILAVVSSVATPLVLATACGALPPAEPTPPAVVDLPTSTPTPRSPSLPLADGVIRPPDIPPHPAPDAACGVVDTLDLPLGPPDGEGFAARWSFGRNSGRYQGLHAGEDWVSLSGSTLGKPVHAIGHGTVTYADPYGWGQTDRGVIIVRHVFPDGEAKLSFYGHVQPDSVQVHVGDCVVRGQVLARVDKPRGRPHLHFEVRDHLPNEPGPGYWPHDPRLAGWYPPSAYLQAFRAGVTPGARWTRPFTTGKRAELIGALADGSIALHDGVSVQALAPTSGRPLWHTDEVGPVAASVVDVDGRTLYVASQDGVLRAFQAAEAAAVAVDLDPDSANAVAAAIVGVRPSDDGPSRAADWEVVPPQSGVPVLVPLPGGGVGIHVGGELVGITPDGTIRWRLPGAGRPDSWLLDGDKLIYSTALPESRVLTLNGDGELAGPVPPGGQLARLGDRIVLYRPEGLDIFDPVLLSATPLLALEPGAIREGQALEVPGIGLLVTHRGATDSELILVDEAGHLAWRHSIAALGYRLPRLAVSGTGAYLLTAAGDVLALDSRPGAAILRWRGGGDARAAKLPEVLALDGDGGLLLDPGMGYVVAVDAADQLAAGGG